MEQFSRMDYSILCTILVCFLTIAECAAFGDPNSDVNVTVKDLYETDCKQWPCFSDAPTGKPVVCSENFQIGTHIGSLAKTMNTNLEIICRTTHMETNISLLVDGKVVSKNDFRITHGSCSVKYEFRYNKGCYSLKHFECRASNKFGDYSYPKFKVEFIDRSKTVDFFVGTSNEDAKRNENRMIAGSKGRLTCRCNGNKDSSLSSTSFHFFIKDDSGQERFAGENDFPRFTWIPKEGGLSISNVTEQDSREFICYVYVTNYLTCPFRKTLEVKVGKCRPGFYCSRDSWKETPCPAGTYNPHFGIFGPTGCQNCTSGHYCPPQSSQPVQCTNTVFESINQGQDEGLEPAKSEGDCRRCPLKKTCSEDGSCSLLCHSQPVTLAKVENDVVLKCHVSVNASRHQVKLQWIKDGVKLGQMGDRFKEHYEAGAYSLTIQSVKVGDSGRYRCQGQYPNYMKSGYAEMSLKVLTSPFDVRYLYLLVLLFIPAVVVLVIVRHCNSSASRGSLGSSCADLFFNDDHGESNLNQDRGNLELKPHEDVEQFDAFVTYSERDCDWVLQHLIPKLESESIQLCLHFRDFDIGGAICENIVDAVHKSRKTIAVLSPSYIKSEWCNYELQHAIARMGNRVVPIKLLPCEVPKVLNNVTFLDWTDQRARPEFWTRLVSAIKGKC